ncbi:MAG: nucleotidyltransferase domain-containing protein [Candidatus Omnitrophica bacterium]|nr:nucleotidyltransferase domain-containing protein [Candidatus Omnitrophota bacterium]
MKKKNGNNLFSSTNTQKILSFLVDNPSKEFLAKEIQKAAAISKAGVYVAILELVKQGLVFKKGKGRSLLYSLNYEEPLIKQFKAFKNVLLLRTVLSKLKNVSKKIILYGSASRGEDTGGSDIDLFIVSREPLVVKEILASLKTKRKLQAVVKTPTGIAEFKIKEHVYWEEVARGIVLWEEKE